MTTKLFSFFILTSILLGACAKDENAVAGVDADGFCTLEFVNGYNGVVDQYRAFKQTYMAAELNEKAVAYAAKDLRNSGNQFQSSFGDVQCEAVDFDTNQRVQATALDLKPLIETSAKVLEPRSQNKPIPQKAADVFTEKDDLPELDVVHPAG
jgi:hypothetical protein